MKKYEVYCVETSEATYNYDTSLKDCEEYIKALDGRISPNGENRWESSGHTAKLVHIKTGQVIQTLAIRQIW